MGTVKYTGPVASFHCPTNAEIRSLKVHFSPKQLGEGTPSPDNVREIEGWDGVEVYQSGKNLFNPETVTMNMEIGSDGNPLATGSSNRWCITDFIPVKPNTTYIARALLTAGSGRSAVYDANKEKVSTKMEVLGADAETVISIGSTGRYVRLTVRIADGLNTTFEEASSVTAYEPYHGPTTNYEFGVLGKNKFDKSQSVDGRIMKANGTNYTADSGYYISPFIPVVAGASYTKNSPVVDAYHRFATYSSDNVNSFIRVFDTSNTITIEPGENYIRFCGEMIEIDTAQLELGSTATTYEPYDSNHTVYGGWVDLITGEVCEEWWHCVLGAITNGTYVSQSTYIQCNINPVTVLGASSKVKGDSKLNVISEYCKTDSSATDVFAVYNATNGNVILRMPNPTVTTVNEMKEYMEEHNLPISFKLATPITYSLAPTQLQTFLGTNNVWSNADYVEVEYDLHETQDILARKNFIMASQPHVEEASGAIATFNTDMAAKLKECKVYFKPVQEGEGDPNPENVRAISGWMGVSIYQAKKNLAEKPSEFYRGYSGKAYNDVTDNLVVTDTGFKCTPKNGSSGYATFIAYVHAGQIYTLSFTKTGECARWSYSIMARRNFGTASGESLTGLRLFDSGWRYSWNTPVQFTCPIDGYLYLGSHQNNSTPTEYEYSNIQLELGSTATEYEPYNGETIPITFPTTVNLFNEQWEQGNIEVGNNAGSSTCMRTGFIDVNSSTSYYLYTPRESNVFVFEYLEDGTYADKVNNVYTSHVFTTGSTTKKIRIVDRNSGTETVNTGINYPSTITYYEPYGTIYGGYVDLISGNVWKTADIYDLGNLSWFYNSNNDCFCASFTNISNNRTEPRILACSHYKYEYVNKVNSMADKTINDSQQLNLQQIQIHDNDYDGETLNNFQSAMSGIKIIYVLATPTIITILSPSQLKTLRGTNNVWSSANGNIELSYWKH